MRKISFREALREAHHEALTKDPRVFLMGEDVGKYGGSYAVSPAPASAPRSAACARSSK